MSKFDWSIAGDETRWAQAMILTEADSNDLDMIDATRHIKEVAA